MKRQRRERRHKRRAGWKQKFGERRQRRQPGWKRKRRERRQRRRPDWKQKHRKKRQRKRLAGWGVFAKTAEPGWSRMYFFVRHVERRLNNYGGKEECFVVIVG